jgi:hypothetical protein
MRLYSAMQHPKDNRWRYVCSGGYEIGYCHARMIWTAEEVQRVMGNRTDPAAHAAELNAKTEPFAAKYHTDGHATAAEAEACYRQFQLDQELRFHDDNANASSQHRCKAPGCAAFTSGMALMGEFNMLPMCSLHRNRESVEAVLDARAKAKP